MSDQPAENEEFSENFRVVDPSTGMSIFELGQPWPQPEPHTHLVRALFALEQAKDLNTPVPKEFGDDRLRWADTLKKKIGSLEDAVAAKVATGEPLPAYAIVHAIVVDEDRIHVVGRSVGRWKDRPITSRRGVSCDLPYNKFAIETKWTGEGILKEFLDELKAEDDDEDEDEPASPPGTSSSRGGPSSGSTAALSDICLATGCGTPLEGAPFCKACGTQRGRET